MFSLLILKECNYSFTECCTLNMGRTARKSKNPFAAINRRKSANKESSAETTLRQSRYDYQPGPAVPTHDVDRMATTVMERIMLELQDQITQAIEAMNRSPHVVSTPENIQQPMLSGINHTNTNLSTNERSNIAPSFSDDLGTNVSQQLRDKIINGEYLELEFLLSNSHNDQSRTIFIDNYGNLNLKQKSGKKITDIGTWIDAFLIYTSIYTAAHSSSTQGLL